MKNRVRRMVEDDESLKYAEYKDHNITKVGIPPPVLSQHQSKVADKTEGRKRSRSSTVFLNFFLENFLRPVTFNPFISFRPSILTHP